jgi:hypothetical protein
LFVVVAYAPGNRAEGIEGGSPMPRWEIAEQGAFDRLPPRTPQKAGDPEWEELVTALEAGDDVRLPYENEKEMRGLRLSVGRRAKRRGFRVELRYGDGFLIARRSGDGAAGEDAQRGLPGLLANEEPANGAVASKPRGGRRRRTAEEA